MSAPAPVEIDQSTQHPVRRATLWVSRAISYVVYAYVVVVEIILFLGFLLLLLGANPTSSFVEWVYRSMDRAMRPFRGIFEPVELGTTQADVPSVLDTSVLFAMIVYAILAIAIHSLLEWLSSRLARLDRSDEEYRRQQAIQQAYAASSMPGSAPGSATPTTTMPATTGVPPGEPTGPPPTPPPPGG